jgi:hypothetical protein
MDLACGLYHTIAIIESKRNKRKNFIDFFAAQAIVIPAER